MAVTTLLNKQAHLKRTVALVLTHSSGSELYELTNTQSKPCVPFGGKYRLIDFALSNCLNSGVGHIGVVSSGESQTLTNHVLQGWDMTADNGTRLVRLLPDANSPSNTSADAGTTRAIFQNVNFVMEDEPEYVLVVTGDHLYKMDYTHLIEHHVGSGADFTMSTIETSSNVHANRVAVNDAGRIVELSESTVQQKTSAGESTRCLSSMGVYVFNAKYFAQVLAVSDLAQMGNDFEKDVVPNLVKKHYVMAYEFNTDHQTSRYWKDVSTVNAYWQANMDLIGATPRLNLNDAHWPIRTLTQQVPPAKFVYDSAEICGAAVNSLICEGCVISGALIKNSVMHTNVIADEQTHIIDSVVLPNCTIGKHCSLRRVVLDADCVVPDGLVIGYDRAEDERRFRVSSDHTVLVTQSMLDAIGSGTLQHAA